ncbi:LuxR family transcriptional regulator [Arsenophonus sp.]|uniref:helix-turn-helix transcriptional regulator n=1 Tax=Arsenophonus sp. TaxID=1872640 RepID=UPI002857AEB4|nr:LuxR family transcriptional regulator [Arsenophonus sp.]MDR5610325.1 LuxR family transcriptional regulator [Arsenophonus sp.]MDR5614092.1 LuxR family transcriptional regulator [Arsenophonus sp.]
MSNLNFNNKNINNVIKEFLERELNKIGDLKYSYIIMKKNHPSCFFYISNYPEKWAEIYKKNAYQYIDPVIINSLNDILPFSWNENIIINSNIKLKEVFKIAKKYHIISGHTFILHDQNNNLATLSILIDSFNEFEIKTKINNNKDRLQMLLMLTHKKLISAYKEISKKNNKNAKIFSCRENEILYWVTMGKTYSEISIILGIKTGTIKFHMSNVIKKLGVCNAKQAIRISTELKLVESVIT